MSVRIHFDGDIDANNQWSVDGLTCRHCHAETAYLSPVSSALICAVTLSCGECMEPLTPAFDYFTKEELQ